MPLTERQENIQRVDLLDGLQAEYHDLQTKIARLRWALVDHRLGIHPEQLRLLEEQKQAIIQYVIVLEKRISHLTGPEGH